MSPSSSEKEPLLPKPGDKPPDHTFEVRQTRQTEEFEQEQQQPPVVDPTVELKQKRQREAQQYLGSALRELFPFFVSTGIEIPKSYVWRMMCVLLYVLTGVVFPVFVTMKYHPDFIVISIVVRSLHIILACICFSHISCEVWKQGMESYLQLEKLTTSTGFVRAECKKKIKIFQFSWICSFISCSVARGIYEIVRLVFMPNRSLWMILISIISFIAWTFLSMTILSACNLFGLACRLVTIQLKNLKGDLNQRQPTLGIWVELQSIRSNVVQISSNFSWFLLLTFLVVNVSFMLIMLHTLAHKEMIHVIINCDFLLYVIVQVFGLSICLYYAAIVSNEVLDIISRFCEWRVEEILLPNDGADDTIRQALCEYSRFALDGISVSGYTIDSSAVVGIVFFEIGVLQFILGNQSNLLGAMGIFFYRSY